MIYNYCADRKRGETVSPKTGRPPKENPKSARIYIRVTEEEKESIMKDAHNVGLSLLELLKKGIEAVKEK